MTVTLLTEAQFTKLRDEIKAIPSKEIRKKRLLALLELQRLTDEVRTEAEKDAARRKTRDLLELLGKVAGHAANLQDAGGSMTSNAADDTVTAVTDLIAEAHAALGLPRTFATEDEEPEIDDEAQTPVEAVTAPVPRGREISTQPLTSTASDYETLAPEYVKFFAGAQVAAGKKSDVAAMVKAALDNRDIYQDLEETTETPWWFIAGLHQMEASYNFKTHLHNGDPLTARTVRVPKDRPVAPPASGGAYEWEESARDALERKGLTGEKDWSLPRALYRWEAYNGFGYRKHRVPTPYLWGLSTVHAVGKFTTDHGFDAGAKTKQVGAAMLLKALHDAGHVNDLRTEVVPETDDDSEVPAAPPTTPPADAAAPALTDFAGFFAARLPDIRFFKPEEFLFKGASNATHNLNEDPPEALWENVVDLAKVLDVLRAELDAPIYFNSVYRSPAYNEKIGGAARSLHKQFKAADFHVRGGAGGPKAWAAKLRRLRSEGLFSGGVGVYDSFVHLDTRGVDVDWKG